MSIRRLGDSLLAIVIESLGLHDAARLMLVSSKFHALARPSLETKCKLSCVLEYLPALLAAHRMQVSVPSTWMDLHRTFACINRPSWSPCPPATSNALSALSIDRYEYAVDTTTQVLTRCGGHYRFEVWTLPISAIEISQGDSDDTSAHEVHSTLQIKGWTRLDVAGAEPTPRRHHSVTCLPVECADHSHAPLRRVLIFGGHAERFPFQSFNDVYICLEKDGPPSKDQGDFPPGASWITPEISGQAPHPRSGHVATLMSRQTVAISGGSHGARPISAFEVHLLHVDDEGFCSFRWSTPTCDTYCPRGRSFHSVFRLSRSSYLVFGGKQIGDTTGLFDVHKVDLDIHDDSCAWSEPQLQGDVPAPRRGHSVVAIGSKLLVFGGDLLENCSLTNEAFLFTPTRNTWHRIDALGETPSPRRGHAAQFTGTSVILHGGFDADHDKLPKDDAHMLLL